MFATPILFLIFNRPHTTAQVFEQIRKQRPKYLFIAADGPRANTPADEANCAQSRQVINLIDWDCEVKTLLRQENLGCGAGPAQAISWFFEHVEEGIILEDDCVPTDSFFNYCSTLLQKYRNSSQVMMICGTSYQPSALNADSYYFSKYPHVWGWATWKRSWSKYKFRLDAEDPAIIMSVINKTFRNARERKMWEYNLQIIRNGLDAWDYQLMYWMWKNDSICIVPWKNMVSNIGFGAHATHTFDTDSKQSAMQQHDLPNIIHPKEIAVNTSADNYERYNILLPSATKYYFDRVKAIGSKLLRSLRLIYA